MFRAREELIEEFEEWFEEEEGCRRGSLKDAIVRICTVSAERYWAYVMITWAHV